MFEYREDTRNDEMIYKLLPSGLDNLGLQGIIKQIFLKKNMKEFFLERITEDNILLYSNLLKQDFRDYDEDSNTYILISGPNRKYLFDLIIALTFEEAISIEEILEIIEANDYATDVIEIFERMLVLELGLFTLNTAGLTLETTQYSKKFYITDNIPTLTYGKQYTDSYENEENILNELNLIETSALLISPLTEDQKTILTNLGYYTDTNITNSITRINRLPANIEGINIPKFSFLLNYNYEDSAYNETLLRKFYAIQSYSTGTTRGSYRKLVDGVIVTKYFTDLSEISYYDELSNMITNKDDYIAINEYLKTFWTFILDRTIN